MKRSMMQTVFLLVFLLYPLCAGASVIQEKVYDICKYGAKGDGKTLNTNAINSAIEYCAENGGGTVLIPKGTFLSGTIYLKDNISLVLRKGAVLNGTADVSQSKTYTPLGNLSMFDSGGDGENANSAIDPHWNRALILGVGVSNISIEG